MDASIADPQETPEREPLKSPLDYLQEHQEQRLARSPGTSQVLVPQSNNNLHSHKRNVAAREADLIAIAQMYLHAYTLEEIRQWINEHRTYSLSLSQVFYDIGTIHRRWQESYLKEYEKAKARELARIDVLERAYWDAWERSQQKKEIVETERIDDKSSGKTGITVPAYQRNRARRREENRDGDSVFLQGIQWCIEQRCKIMGFNAPSKVNINWRKQAEEAGLDPGEVFNDMVGRFVREAAPSRTDLDGDGRRGSLARSTEDPAG